MLPTCSIIHCAQCFICSDCVKMSQDVAYPPSTVFRQNCCTVYRTKCWVRDEAYNWENEEGITCYRSVINEYGSTTERQNPLKKIAPISERPPRIPHEVVNVTIQYNIHTHDPLHAMLKTYEACRNVNN